MPTAAGRFAPLRGGAPEKIDDTIGVPAATQEMAGGLVYSVSSGQRGHAIPYAFNTKTERVESLGPAAVGTQSYITSIDADATGGFPYYVPGARGGSERDG